jgi:hypothetical protein
LEVENDENWRKENASKLKTTLRFRLNELIKETNEKNQTNEMD